MSVNAVFSEARCAQYEFNLTMPASFEVALFLGFRAEGPAIYLAQPIGLGCEV